MINLALAIKSNLYFDLLSRRLKSEKDISIICRPIDENEIVEIAADSSFDVLFLDTSNNEINYKLLIDKIKETNPEVKLIILFHFYNVELFVEALNIGIDGCLNINSDYSTLIQAIRTVSEGGIWADNEVFTFALKKFINKNEKPLKQLSKNLTKREFEISRLILDGLSNKAIANNLYISEKTVKTHVSNIFKKLGIKHRYQLNSKYLDSLFDIVS